MTLQHCSIEDFVNKSEYLGLPDRGITLYPNQLQVLRLLYLETKANSECHRFDSSNLPKQWQEAFDKFSINHTVGFSNESGIMKRYRLPVTEFGLICGRRCGKDLMLAIIALYEAYRLGIDDVGVKLAKSPLSIVVVCPTSAQVKVFKNQLIDLINGSKLFTSGFVYPLAIDSNDIALCFSNTESDLTVKISIRSCQDSFIGISTVSLLFNEAGAYGEIVNKIYAHMLPSLNTYTDVTGVRLGKFVVMSSGKSWFLWDFARNIKKLPCRMVLRAATWEINPCYSEEELKQQNTQINDFDQEYGGAIIEPVDTTEPVTIRLRTQIVESLKRRARERSYKEDRDVAYTDVIREILDSHI